MNIPTKEILESKYKELGTISATARYFKTTNPTLRKWLIHYNIDRKSHKEACQFVIDQKTKPNVKEVIVYYNKGNSLVDVARNFNISQNTLYKILEENGISLRSLSESCTIGKEKRRKHIAPSKEVFEAFYEKYPNLNVCAEHFNVSYSFIRKLAKEYNINIQIPWISKKEQDYFNFISEIDNRFIQSDKSIINPYEIDIICHERKLGIEYCGLYWHSEFYGEKTKNYHANKRKLLEEKGYDLITIFENDDEEKIKRLLKHKIGISNKIGARLTTVKEISSKEASSFHEKYHLHGKCGAKYHYGLFKEDNLIMVMSIGINRFSKESEYEIIRMTTGDIAVIGGPSKLFKYFLKCVNPETVTTFADARFGSGKVYYNLGFEFIGLTKPNYWYFHKNNPSKLFSRVKFQKHKLNKLPNFNENLSEYQNMINNGYDRIWDCGNYKYIYNNNNV